MIGETIAAPNTILGEISIYLPSTYSLCSWLVAMGVAYFLHLALLRTRSFRNSVKTKYNIYVPCEEAYDIVMDHIQDRPQGNPTSVSLATLMKIAIIVQQMKCQDVMGSSPRRWMDELWGRQSWKEGCSWRAMGWMLIARVFGYPDKYREASRRMVMDWRDRKMALRLRLDKSVHEDMWKQRQETLYALLKIYTKLIEDLSYVQTTCTEEECNVLRDIIRSMPCQYFKESQWIDDKVSIAEVLEDLEMLRLRWPIIRFISLSRLHDRLRETRYWSSQGIDFVLLMRDVNREVEGLKGLDMPKSDQSESDGVVLPIRIQWHRCI